MKLSHLNSWDAVKHIPGLLSAKAFNMLMQAGFIVSEGYCPEHDAHERVYNLLGYKVKHTIRSYRGVHSEHEPSIVANQAPVVLIRPGMSVRFSSLLDFLRNVHRVTDDERFVKNLDCPFIMYVKGADKYALLTPERLSLIKSMGVTRKEVGMTKEEGKAYLERKARNKAKSVRYAERVSQRRAYEEYIKLPEMVAA